MSAASKHKVYEIREGSDVLGQFSVKTKALSFKRSNSTEGRRLRIVTRFVSNEDAIPEPEPRPEPKPVPERKKAMTPRKAVEPRTSPPQPPVEPSVVPGYVDGRVLKSLSKIIKGFGNPAIPTSLSSFSVTSMDHCMMLSVTNTSGTGILGLPDSGDRNSGFDLPELARRCSVGSRYTASTDAGEIVLNDGKSRIVVQPRDDVFLASSIRLNNGMRFVVDPGAFDLELHRVRGIMNGGGRNMKDLRIRLCGMDGDLIMSGQNFGCGMSVDIGDGDGGTGPCFNPFFLMQLSDLFLMSDSPCTLTFDERMPLEGLCSIGDLDLRMLIAPMQECD